MESLDTREIGPRSGSASGTGVLPFPAANGNEKRAPPQGGYYTVRKRIMCTTTQKVREMWDRMAAAPVRDARNWRQLDEELGTTAVNEIILEMQRRAHGCICSHHPLIKGPDGEGLKLRASNSEHCRDEQTARMYEKVYGKFSSSVAIGISNPYYLILAAPGSLGLISNRCGCYQLIEQNEDDSSGVTVGDRGSLDGSVLMGSGLPNFEKMRTDLGADTKNYNYMGPGNSWTGYGGAPDRYLASGPGEEPYWLEGPQDLSGGVGWGSNPFMGMGASSGPTGY
ncbi:hypothetical protein TWF481_004525 [Arthrobotrys musiformis]|uniref:Uncharacterized protein n=1 Tax=Arthrobotrys musiformis TaxID=47236 RepID=A0AAV9WKX2_9PEZI